MTLKNVKTSLDKISKLLAKAQDDREFLLRNTREIVILCSRSIISVHEGDIKSAKASIKRAGILIEKYKKKATGDLQRYMIIPEQEYVEAACLISILDNRSIPSDTKLKVMPESYILGLLDCIGELKRVILDKIRTGDLEEATRVFVVMEEMYMHLYPFTTYDKVLKEARRKTDVGRALVDDARGVITEEKRRTDLINVLNNS